MLFSHKQFLTNTAWSLLLYWYMRKAGLFEQGCSNSLIGVTAGDTNREFTGLPAHQQRQTRVFQQTHDNVLLRNVCAKAAHVNTAGTLRFCTSSTVSRYLGLYSVFLIAILIYQDSTVLITATVFSQKNIYPLYTNCICIPGQVHTVDSVRTSVGPEGGLRWFLWSCDWCKSNVFQVHVLLDYRAN